MYLSAIVFTVHEPIAVKLTLFRGYSSLTLACADFLELKKSGLKLLKSTFYTENFIRRMFKSISSHFGTIYSQNVCRSPKSRKIYENR